MNLRRAVGHYCMSIKCYIAYNIVLCHAVNLVKIHDWYTLILYISTRILSATLIEQSATIERYKVLICKTLLRSS